MFERVKKLLLTARDKAFIAMLQLLLMGIVFLTVVVLVLYYFMAGIPLITSGPLNTTQAQIFNLGAAAVNLSTVVLIIIGAAVVLSGVGLIYFGRRRME